MLYSKIYILLHNAAYLQYNRALACHIADCGFKTPAARDAVASIAALVNHVAIAHPDQLPNGARDNRVKPPHRSALQSTWAAPPPVEQLSDKI